MRMHPKPPLYHVMYINSCSSSNCRHRQLSNGWCPRFAQHDTTTATSGSQVSLWVSESLQINGRVLSNIARTGSIIWFDFKDLCSDYRSKNDYIILSEMFNTILISNIPRLTNDRLSSAKRFIWLIDVLYDKKVRLIASAQVSPDELNNCALLENEFKRTASRLIEMQSDYK